MSIHVLCSCGPCAVCEIYVFCFARSLQGYNWAHEESWGIFEEWCTESPGSVDELKEVNKKLDTLGGRNPVRVGFAEDCLRHHHVGFTADCLRNPVRVGVTGECQKQCVRRLVTGITINM